MHVFTLLCFFGIITASCASAYPQAPEPVREKAAGYRRAAQELIAAGRVTDGVKMIRLAIQTDPVDPSHRMAYVAIMSKKGESSLASGARAEALMVFRSVEDELMSAAKLFQVAGDLPNSAHALGQVGDIYRFVYRNSRKAVGYYRKALELDPNSALLQSKARGR